MLTLHVNFCCNQQHMVSHAQDMVAFSCCVFDGGKQERQDMIAARERGWKGKFTKPGRVIRPGAIRINGKCPLTPLEVSILKLLWFPESSRQMLCVLCNCIHFNYCKCLPSSISSGWPDAEGNGFHKEHIYLFGIWNNI
jgi:hypothetical protein